MLQSHYSRVTAAFSTSITPGTINLPRTAEDLLFAHLIFKCVVKVAVWAWNRVANCNDPSYGPWASSFPFFPLFSYSERPSRQLEQLFQASVMQLQSLSEIRMNIALAMQPTPTDVIGQRSVDILTRHVRLFGKLFRQMQQRSVARFVTLPMCGDLVVYYWNKVVQASGAPQEYIAGTMCRPYYIFFGCSLCGIQLIMTDTPYAVFPVRFLVQAMLLFKESLAQWAPVKKDGTQNANGMTVIHIPQ